MGSVLCHFPLLLLSGFIICKVASCLLCLIYTPVYLIHVTFSTCSITYYPWVIFLLLDKIRLHKKIYFVYFIVMVGGKCYVTWHVEKKGKSKGSSDYDCLPVWPLWDDNPLCIVCSCQRVTNRHTGFSQGMDGEQILISSLGRTLTPGSQIWPSVLFLRKWEKNAFVYRSEGTILVIFICEDKFLFTACLLQSFIC